MGRASQLDRREASDLNGVDCKIWGKGCGVVGWVGECSRKDGRAWWEGWVGGWEVVVGVVGVGGMGGCDGRDK